MKKTILRSVYEEKVTVYKAEIDVDLIPENFDQLDIDEQEEFWDDNCEHVHTLVREKWFNDDVEYIAED